MVVELHLLVIVIRLEVAICSSCACHCLLRYSSWVCLLCSPIYAAFLILLQIQSLFFIYYGYQLFNVVLSCLLPVPFNIGVSNIKISIRGITFQNILIGLLSLPFIRKRKRDPPVLTFDG